jgi:phage shock protein E
MKLPILALLLAGALAWPLSAQETPPAKPKAPAKPVVPTKLVTPDEAEKLIKETAGLIVIDVRSPEEFDHQHIKGAVNVNVRSDEFETEIAKLDQSKPILVHCQTGNRSTEAVEILQTKTKFPQIYHMGQGLSGWKKAGKPIEENRLPKPDRRGPPGKPAPPKPAETPKPGEK